MDSDGEPQQQGYLPPPAFAPPRLRTAPLNEWQVLGRTTYPGSPMVPMPVPMPFPVPFAGPPVRSPERGTRVQTAIIVSAVVLALIAVIGALAIGRSAPTTRTLSLPQDAANYVRISTITGSHISTIFGSGGTFGTIPTSDLTRARIGLYGPSSSSPPTALFIGFTAVDSPSIGGQLRSEDAGTVTDQVLAGANATAAARTVDAGPLGGSLRCSTLAVDGINAEGCVWADSDTLGLLLLFDPALSASLTEAGGVTRAFRAQAEH